MKRIVAIGIQSFEDIVTNNCFYIDKTEFIREWWDSMDSDILSEADKIYFQRVLTGNMSETDATSSLYQLSYFLYRYYGREVIILLDEYDTPMQEAYLNGYWDELSVFTRSLFNSIFKTNPSLERGIMIGITRVSKESIFSDLNNLEVVTTTSDKYADDLGFTEQEVWEALDEYGLSDKKEQVKLWYDGFTFGKCKDIYNPCRLLIILIRESLEHIGLIRVQIVL